MKNIATKLLISIASLALAACSVEPVQVEVQAEEQVHTLELKAYVPDAPAAKVSVAPTGKVTWSSGDEIALYNSAGKKFRATLSSGAGTSEGTFTCSNFSGSAGAVAVYPYELAGDEPGTVVLAWRSARSDAVPALMASHFSSSGSNPAELYFRHIAPVIDITLHDIPAYACAMVVVAGDKRICGTLAFDAATLGPLQTEELRSSRMITFPYGAGYGTDLHFRIAVPAGDYSSLSIGLMDGDESFIEGLESIKFGTSSRSLSAADYLVMPPLDIRSRCTRSTAIRKVQGVSWAAGNLIAQAGGATSEGFQTGWRLASQQYEFLGWDTVSSATSATFTQSATAFDRFNWGGLAGDAWRPDAGYMLPTEAKYNISGRIFSADSGDAATLDASEKSGNARFATPAGGSMATGSSLHGDVAFWASKGQYRMPTASEMVLLRCGESAGTASGKAGYVLRGGNRIYGVLLTTTPSWESSVKASDAEAVELTEADLEAGLFLPKTGRGRYISGGNTSLINYVNAQGYYRTSIFSGLNLTDYPSCDHSTTVLGFRAANSCDYGYTTNLNSDAAWGLGHVQKCLAIRPVLVTEDSGTESEPLPQPDAGSLPAWSEGYLDIHAINSARGECTFVILPDGTSMMIDAGEVWTSAGDYVDRKPSSKLRSYKVYSAYAKYFLAATGHDKLDYFVASHYHTDHIGSHRDAFGTAGNGYCRTGVMGVYEELPFIKLIDRCGPSGTPATTDYSEAVYQDFRQFAQYRQEVDGLQWYAVNLNASGNYKKQVALKYDNSYDCTVYNLGANGKYWNGSGFSTYETIYENPSSIVQLISYGNFDYLTSGDCGNQSDILYLVASGLGKKVEAMKAGHHLYYNTFDYRTAAILQPKVTVAQIFDKDKPGDPAFSYYNQYGDVFCTNIHPGRLDNSLELKGGTQVVGLAGKVRDYNGHIVIRVLPGGNEFYVYKLRDTDFSYTVEATYGPYSCH